VKISSKVSNNTEERPKEPHLLTFKAKLLEIQVMQSNMGINLNKN